MDIDTLDENDLLHLIEGYYCYPTHDHSISMLQITLLALIDWHETKDDELMTALAHYRDNVGPRVQPPAYDYDFRHEKLFG